MSFCRDAKSCVFTMRKIARYLTKNRSGKDPKIAQSTHETNASSQEKLFVEIQNSFSFSWENRTTRLSSFLVLLSPDGEEENYDSLLITS